VTSLSIIIVNWNAREPLIDCLNSIASTLDLDSLEVILVDNASTDGSVELVRDRYPWVHLITNDENKGFARANNQAIEICSGHYILLLNPDTELCPHAIENMINCAEDHPQVGAIGPKLLNSDGSLQLSCSPAPTLFREFWRMFLLDNWVSFAKYDMGNWSQESPREVDVVQGACLLLKREVIDEIGILDEDFFVYSEEVDLCRRLRTAGRSVIWEPRARVIHHGGQSTRQVAEEMFICLYQTKVLYFRKHSGGIAAGVYKGILAIASLARLMISPWFLIRSDDSGNSGSELSRNYRRLLRELPRF
jgi:GT2 family glycosyltransferase